MSGNFNVPFQRSQSADFALSQPRNGISELVTQSSGTLPILSSPINLQRRTMEGARHFRESFNNALRQIEPFVETARNVRQNAITFSELLSRASNSDGTGTTQNNTGGETTPNTPATVNYVAISLDGVATEPNPVNVHLNNNGENSENNNRTNDVQNEGGENPVDRLNLNTLDGQQVLQIVCKYIPFILILLAKAVYDFHEGILILVIFFGTFTHANNTVKHEALKRARRSICTLSIELCYLCICLVSIHYLFQEDVHSFSIVMNLVLIRNFDHPLTVVTLLWIVTITDFTLKLLTVMVKLILTMLPGKFIEFKKRGKIYLFIEAISQLYRSIATIQPWLYYLLESYQGPEKIISVLLSACYMISKGSDLMFKVKLLKNAFIKLLQSVALGTSPSKEQIQTAGDHCPICHDNYESPVLLQCRHIFCESCVSTWFDREQTCPLCRAKIVDDPSWRDGSTSFFIQLF